MSKGVGGDGRKAATTIKKVRAAVARGQLLFPDRILAVEMELPASTASCPSREMSLSVKKKLGTGTQARRGIEPRQISLQPCLLSSH